MFSTFRSRLNGILLFINVCMLVLGGCAFFFLGEVGSRLHHFTQGIYSRMEIANRLRSAADARAIAVRNVALIQDAGSRDEQARVFERLQAETRDALRDLQAAVASTGLPPNVVEKVNAIVIIEGRYAPVAQEIVAQIRAGQRDQAIARIERECNPTLAQLMGAIGDYMKLTEQRTRSYVEETEATAEWERKALLVAALCVGALAGAAGIALRRSVHRTLGAEPEALRAELATLAAGDLSSRDAAVDAPRDSLAGAVANVRQQIGDIVRQVRTGSEQIATGSAEIAGGNTDLSRRTEDQAGALQRTASAMAELGGTVRSNAENAQHANQLAHDAATVATEGGEVVTRVVSTMNGISESGRRIGDIIAVIDGIAFQTNILALNAAVEAARAGEQGRGFAVVASEVRSLAQRSAEAAREIKSLIERNIEQVGQGAALVDQAGRTMQQIVESVRTVSTIVGDITTATVEQGRGIEEVSLAVGSMEQVTQQNTALVEQSAAASESLRHLAHQLVRAVAAFKLP